MTLATREGSADAGFRTKGWRLLGLAERAARRADGFASRRNRRAPAAATPERRGEGADRARECLARGARGRRRRYGLQGKRDLPSSAGPELDRGSVGSVSIEARGMTVRLDGDIDAGRIAEVASLPRALR